MSARQKDRRSAGRPPIDPPRSSVRVTSVSLYGPDSRKLESFLDKVNRFNEQNGLPRASRSDIIRRAIRLLRDEDVEIYSRMIAGFYEGEGKL